MKFFKRKEKNHESDEDKLYDELLKSYTDDDSPDKITLEAELERIRKQIDEANEEHEAVLAKLMPAKWELLDKKEQLRHVNDEYDEVSSRLSKAKSELDEIMRKLDKFEPDDK